MSWGSIQDGSIDQYQEATGETAIYPGRHDLHGIMYAALGLAGEAGEIANKVKKLYRDEDSREKREVIAAELGDVAWYMAELATQLDMRLSDILQSNLDKLKQRSASGTLKGSGDDR